MNIFITFIPYIESFFVLVILGLGGYLGYLSLSGSGEISQRNQNQSRLKWILLCLIGLAFLSITLLFFISFSQE